MHILKTKITILVLAVSLFCLSACTTKMTLEEARKTAVSISGRSADLPQRRINDILIMLDQPGKFGSTVIDAMKERADATISPQAGSAEYYRRGQAAWELGRYQQGIADLRRAVEIDRNNTSPNYMYYLYLGTAERRLGNFRTALELCEDSLKIAGSQSTGTMEKLAVMYAMLGQMDKALEMKSRLDGQCRHVAPNKTQLLHLCNLRKKTVDAFFLELDAKFEQAEPLRREEVELANGLINDYPSITINTKIALAMNLIKQQRFNEAEITIRKALQESIALNGVNSPLTIDILFVFGNIFTAQSRIADAEKITLRAIKIGDALDPTRQNIFSARARTLAGDLEAMKGNFGQAQKQYNLAYEGMRNFPYELDSSLIKNHLYLLALIMTGDLENAEKTISEASGKSLKKPDGNDFSAALYRALLGMINKRQGNLTGAFNEYSRVLPVLESRPIQADNYAAKRLLSFVIDDYVDLFAQIKAAKLEQKLGIEAGECAFKLAEMSRQNSIQGDIAASSVRAAIHSPELAELVRKEQDAEKMLHVLQSGLSDLLAAPADDIVEKGIRTINTKISRLSEARSVIRKEIRKNYPDYENFINPPAPTIESVRKNLRKGEALIVLHLTEDKTFVWAVPYKGDVQFALSRLGNREISLIVSKLRKSLDCNPAVIADIPEFDANLSYDLYSKLLKPVASAWKDATDLLFVTNGSLGQLPLSVLLTQPVRPGKDHAMMFDRYRNYPWLIKKASIAVIPSVSSLVLLRNVSGKDVGDRKAFIGFGDPVFSKDQLAGAVRTDNPGTIASRGMMNMRSIRVVDKGSLDSEYIESVRMDTLNRLPDTAEELRSIARSLAADPAEDVRLGLEATKTNVMAMKLNDRKVVAFATHALVPGDLDGLNQPALALTPSTVTGKPNDDGLLTMEDILKLNLNSDWVVLSACNTAAAQGAGAEALTGLCRAFFYAGTKSVLASMYPVETTSARLLVTNIFGYQKAAQSTSRSRALQNSMLTLMEKTTLLDEKSGRVVSSYAHPFFWAPFVVVGETGLAQ